MLAVPPDWVPARWTSCPGLASMEAGNRNGRYRGPEEAPPMNAPDDNTATARSGLRRVISPWEYRHLRFWAGVRIGGGLPDGGGG